MSEIVKTLLFVGTTILIVVAALFSLPSNKESTLNAMRNKLLFNDIDLDKVQRVRVVKYDGVATETLEVRKTETGWIIPSENDYPADAITQVNRAIRFLPEMILTNIASDREADKEKYGVIEPKEAMESVGRKNVGTLVELLGDSETPLASAVVGAKVLGDETKSFVLVPGRPHIYVVELNPELLSTNFRDWIDQDLLKLDPFQIQELTLQRVAAANPAVNPATGEVEAGLDYDYEMKVGFETGKWSLQQLLEYGEDRKPKQVELQEGQRLDNRRLNQLGYDLARLRIADVKRKPPGLRSDLLADKDYIGKVGNQISLRDHGFFVVPGGNGGFQILSKGGEIILTMRNGVEYLLRFGDFASASLDDEGKANRYVLVSARLNEDAFPMPVRGAAKAPEVKTDEEPPVPDGVEKDKDTANEDTSNEDECGLQAKADDEQRTKKEEEQAERDYLRKLDIYKQNVEQAKAKVQQLNNRYSDWYYVIVEDEYKKLFPLKDDLILANANKAE